MDKIAINLDQSDNNAQIEAKDLIQQDTYNKLIDSINNDLSSDISHRNRGRGEPSEHSGLVYFIDGTRGAGKSTFLKSLHKGIEKELTDTRVKRLAYIDPSRIEDGEIILMGILKAIKDVMSEHFRSENSLDSESNQTVFREKFKKLAGGLSLFAKNNDQFESLDEELFLEWGLERAANSDDLRKNLHSLIELCCEILSCDALVLAFDDADTNAKHAQNTLECIRKYLDTPYLIVLVTGDLELYSLMVRNHFYNSLGSNQEDRIEERQNQRRKMVDHLEDQYLLKVFPIQRRFQLRPLWNLLNKEENINILLKRGEPAKSVDSVVESLIRNGLRVKTSRDILLFKEFILKQPLRSTLQVLSQCAEPLNKKNDLWTPELANAVSDSFRGLALGSLYKFGVDTDAIATNELPALIHAVFDLAVKDGDFDTAAYLRPQPSNIDLKNSFASLASDVTRLCAKKPSLIINYMLAGPGSVALYDEVLRSHSQPKEELRDQFEQYMGMGRKEDALNWARHAVAVISTQKRFSTGSAYVYSGVLALNKSSRNKLPHEEDFKTIKKIIESSKKTPVFACSLIDVSAAGASTYASIYNILGIMARLLSLEVNDKHSIEKVIRSSSITLTVSPPQWAGGNAEAINEDYMDETESDESSDPQNDNKITHETTKDFHQENNSNNNSSTPVLNVKEGDSSEKREVIIKSDEELVLLIGKWIQAIEQLGLKDKIIPSAILIGKIWTRIYFSLEKICDENRPNLSKIGANGKAKASAASIMELMALCVVNAFFIEELDHHRIDGISNVDIAIDRNNPVASTVPVFKRLDLIKDNLKHFPMTYLVLTCPLIMGFIKKGSASIEFFKSLITSSEGSKIYDEKDIESLLCDKDNWDGIEKALVAGIKKSKSNT